MLRPNGKVRSSFTIGYFVVKDKEGLIFGGMDRTSHCIFRDFSFSISLDEE